MIAQCRPDVRLEEMQGFVVQGPHHANTSILVEGLVVKRLLGVRGRVAARQSDQARLERCPPDPSVVGFWTLGVDSLLPQLSTRTAQQRRGHLADNKNVAKSIKGL